MQYILKVDLQSATAIALCMLPRSERQRQTYCRWVTLGFMICLIFQ